MEDLLMKTKIKLLLITLIVLTCFIGCAFEEINEDKNNDSFNPNTNESEFASNAFPTDISSNKADEFNTDNYTDSYITYTFTNLDEFYLYAETDEDDCLKFPCISEFCFPGEPVFKYIDKDKFIRLEDIFPEFLDGKLKLSSIGVVFYNDYSYYFEEGLVIYIGPIKSSPETEMKNYPYIEESNKLIQVRFRLDNNMEIIVRVNKDNEDKIKELSIDSLNELLSGEYTILAEHIAKWSETKKN